MVDPKSIKIDLDGDGGYCPLCEKDFTESDDDFEIMVFKNCDSQWVGVAYHARCKEATRLGPKL